MPEFEPSFATSLADDVYNIETDFQREAFADKYKKDFDMPSGKPAIKGVTGASFIKKKSVMGVAALGKGRFENDAVVALRGTASLFDALTDLNAGVKVSHTGSYIHQGFFDSFDTLLPEIRDFLGTYKGTGIVHCVGHSLGGALATLAADWIGLNTAATVKLYTFGSPRVGLDFFAQKTTTSIGVENIYRAFHQTDPVPMVPTWPFFHVPNNNSDYPLVSSVEVPPWKYHFMLHYSESVAGKSWKTIKSKRPAGQVEEAAEQWLRSDGFVSLTSNTIELLNAALMWVLIKIVNLAGIVLVGGFATTFTLLDRLAYILHKAIDFSQDLSFWVFRLVMKITQALGMVTVKAENMTTAFIRMVFVRLHNTIREYIQKVSRQLF